MSESPHSMHAGRRVARLDDSGLLRLVKSSHDQQAFAVLWQRHRDAALTQAKRLAASDAEDVCSEAFTQIWAQCTNGKGPVEGRQFRAYTLATVRNIAARWYAQRRQLVHASPLEDDGPLERIESPSEDRGDIAAALNALDSLPERWREVLRLLEVDQMSRSVVAEKFGLTPNSVSVLKRRAEEALRNAWLRQMLPAPSVVTHPEIVERLPKYVRGVLTRGNEAEVSLHLGQCVECFGYEQGLREDVPRSTTVMKGAFAWLSIVAAGAGTGVLTEEQAVVRPASASQVESTRALSIAQGASVAGAAVKPGLPLLLGSSAMAAIVAAVGIVLSGVPMLPTDSVHTAGQPVPVQTFPAETEAQAKIDSSTGESESPQEGAFGADIDLDGAIDTVEQASTRSAEVLAPTLATEVDIVSPRTVAPSNAASHSPAGAPPDAAAGPLEVLYPFTFAQSADTAGAFAPVVSGRSVPGSEIVVAVGDFSAAVVVAADGSWNFDFAHARLSAGTHTATISQGFPTGQSAQTSFTTTSPTLEFVGGSSTSPQFSLLATGLPGMAVCVKHSPGVYQHIALEDNGTARFDVPAEALVDGLLQYAYCEGQRFGAFSSIVF